MFFLKLFFFFSFSILLSALSELHWLVMKRTATVALTLQCTCFLEVIRCRAGNRGSVCLYKAMWWRCVSGRSVNLPITSLWIINLVDCETFAPRYKNSPVLLSFFFNIHLFVFRFLQMKRSIENISCTK